MRKRPALGIFLGLLFGLMFGIVSYAQEPQTGYASYYSDSLEGKRTASGEPYRKDAFTAAHRTLPFHTKLKVTNLSNNRSVIVVVNDRGPFVKTRITDLSKAAARELGILKKGKAKVRIEVISVPEE